MKKYVRWISSHSIFNGKIVNIKKCAHSLIWFVSLDVWWINSLEEQGMAFSAVQNLQTFICWLIKLKKKSTNTFFKKKKEKIKMNKSILNYWNGLVCPALNRTKWCEFEIFGRSMITLISCCTNKKSDFPEKWLSAMAHCLVDEMCWNPLENWPIFVQIDKHLEIRYFGIDPIAVFSAEYIHETRSKMNRAITCMYAFD